MAEARISWWRTDLGAGESSAVARAIADRHINPGPVCLEFESRIAELLKVPHVVCTTSGSVALLMAFLACGVKPGDEVILPAAGFIAAAHAVKLLGARVKLVDVCSDLPLIDPQQIQASFTEKTKVVVPIHLNGRGCDLDSLRTLTDARNLRLVEDCAQAFCSRNETGCLGTQSDFGTFSLGLTKLITTGEGGFVITESESDYQRLLKLRNQGVLVMRDNAFNEFGFNFRFNDLLASVGLAQVNEIEQKIAAVKRVYAFYEERLRGLHYLRLLPVRQDRGELPLWTEAVCSERSTVLSLLAEQGIDARPFHPCLADSPHLDSAGSFPNARFFSSHGLVLPCGPHQSQADLERTVQSLWRIGEQITSNVPSELRSEQTLCTTS